MQISWEHVSSKMEARFISIVEYPKNNQSKMKRNDYLQKLWFKSKLNGCVSCASVA